MNKFLVSAAGALLAASTAAGAAPQTAPTAPETKPAALDPGSLALAHQVVTIAYPPDKRSQMYASIMDSIVAQTRKNVQSKVATGDKDFDAILDRSMQRMYDQMKAVMNASIPDYFQAFERAYARDFSRDDLQAILAFAKTPEGHHFFERSPLLLKDPDVQAATQRMQTQLFARMPEIQRQVMKDVQDYVARKASQEKAAAPTPVS